MTHSSRPATTQLAHYSNISVTAGTYSIHSEQDTIPRLHCTHFRMARPELHPESKKFLELRAKLKRKPLRELGSVDAARACFEESFAQKTPAVQYAGSRKELFIPQPDSVSGRLFLQHCFFIRVVV